MKQKTIIVVSTLVIFWGLNWLFDSNNSVNVAFFTVYLIVNSAIDLNKIANNKTNGQLNFWKLITPLKIIVIILFIAAMLLLNHLMRVSIVGNITCIVVFLLGGIGLLLLEIERYRKKLG